MSDSKDRQSAMLRVQQLSFALTEATLYLDSHPTCEKGIAYFKKHKAELDKAKEVRLIVDESAVTEIKKKTDEMELSFKVTVG